MDSRGRCNVPPRIVATEIPDGDPGIEVILDAMEELVHGSTLAVDPDTGCVGLTRPLGRHIVKRVSSPAARARELKQWLARRYVFRPDPAGRELIKSPNFLLREFDATGRLEGDCEDLAALAAALGAIAGLRSRFVVIALDEDGPMEHIWTELHDGTRWLELDLVAVIQGIFPTAQAGARRLVREVKAFGDGGPVYDRTAQQGRLGSYAFQGTSLAPGGSFGFNPGGSYGFDPGAGGGYPGGSSLNLDVGGWLGDAWDHVRDALGDAAGDLAADVVGWIQQRIGREAWQRMPETSKRAAIEEATRDVRSRLVSSSTMPLLLLGGLALVMFSRRR